MDLYLLTQTFTRALSVDLVMSIVVYHLDALVLRVAADHGLVGKAKRVPAYHLEEDVDDEDVEHIFERVDDAVEHSLEFGNTLDCLEGPEDAEHAQRLDRAEVLAGRAPSA